MARTPDGAEPRTVAISLRLTATGGLLVEVARGARTRSQYLRDLIAADCETRNITTKDDQ